MHQFGHVYALQQELLDVQAQNWFRAMELWHTARQEGVAMNSSHFTNIARQCVQPGAWEQALWVIQQQKRECIRPDVVCVGCVLATCVHAKRYDEVERIFKTFSQSMMLDSVCYLALIRARSERGDVQAVMEAGRAQEAAGVPFLPHTYEFLLEAVCDVEDDAYAVELVRRMEREEWVPTARTASALSRLRLRGALDEVSLASHSYLRVGDGGASTEQRAVSPELEKGDAVRSTTTPSADTPDYTSASNHVSSS